jgi:hypothetical protein
MHILIKDIGLPNYHCNHPQGVHIWYMGINSDLKTLYLPNREQKSKTK